MNSCSCKHTDLYIYAVPESFHVSVFTCKFISSFSMKVNIFIHIEVDSFPEWNFCIFHCPFLMPLLDLLCLLHITFSTTQHHGKYEKTPHGLCFQCRRINSIFRRWNHMKVQIPLQNRCWNLILSLLGFTAFFFFFFNSSFSFCLSSSLTWVLGRRRTKKEQGKITTFY